MSLYQESALSSQRLQAAHWKSSQQQHPVAGPLGSDLRPSESPDKNSTSETNTKKAGRNELCTRLQCVLKETRWCDTHMTLIRGPSTEQEKRKESRVGCQEPITWFCA